MRKFSHITRTSAQPLELIAFILLAFFTTLSFPDISPCPHTDHDLVTASFVFKAIFLEKSALYFHCSLLSANFFQQLIQNFSINWHEAKTNFPDLATWWDRAKEEIKDLSRNYSANKFHVQQKELKDRKKKL